MGIDTSMTLYMPYPVLVEMKKDNFLDDFVSNPNLPYYICNKEELEIRNVQIN